MITVTQKTSVSLESILNATPAGRVAMFRVTSASASVEDWVIGEHVYVKKNRVYDFMSDQNHGRVEFFTLEFISYIEK